MRTNRVRVGLYGLAFHAVVVAAYLGVARSNRAPIDARFWTVGALSLFAASFIVYALLVAPYVARRVQKRGVAFLDAAIGMAAEPAVAILATLLYSVVSAGPALREGAGAFAGALGGLTYVGLLWLAANFATQILVLGNAAGFIGFILLKLLAARAARTA
ncbi:hypothetical protein [Anaeromyxobacter sp. Fw109-5]|uniref:hypothetical protein n=1 Tax=Anaeromyxobacter sp. (strain Fw109-5) TaxID=404589 RepID=UPI000158A879|nr:hypothetical protein [Anaeromyxobacter sp. Fw109-5]ABS28006.1 hypothetical protein Anae109_3827 [Anaeromyxobacter sp. Fw109-5]